MRFQLVGYDAPRPQQPHLHLPSLPPRRTPAVRPFFDYFPPAFDGPATAGTIPWAANICTNVCIISSRSASCWRRRAMSVEAELPPSATPEEEDVGCSEVGGGEKARALPLSL